MGLWLFTWAPHLKPRTVVMFYPFELQIPRDCRVSGGRAIDRKEPLGLFQKEGVLRIDTTNNQVELCSPHAPCILGYWAPEGRDSLFKVLC